MTIKLLLVAFVREEKMSNRITKEWSDIYVCHILLMSLMFCNAKRKHHVIVIYGITLQRLLKGSFSYLQGINTEKGEEVYLVPIS